MQEIAQEFAREMVQQIRVTHYETCRMGWPPTGTAEDSSTEKA